MGEQVRIDVVAEDKASDVLEDVAKEAKKVEDLDPKVTIAADAAKAQRAVSDVLADVKKLDSQDATIVLALRAAAVEQELTDILQTVAKVDAEQATVDVELERAGELRADLDQLQTAIEDLNATSIDIDTTKATTGLKKMQDEGESTRSSVSSMANSVGNNASELGAAFGLGGPLGQSIGEFGEYMSEARLEGEKFGSILTNFGKFAGPIAVLGTATAVVQQFMKAAQEADKLHADKVKAYADAIRDGADATDTFIEAAMKAGRIDFTAGGGGIFGMFQATNDLIPLLNAAGIKVEDFAAKVKSFSEDQAVAYYEAFQAMGLSVQDAGKLLGAVRQEHDAQADAADKATAINKVFGDTLADNARKTADSAQETAQLTVNTDRAARAANDASRAWDELSGSLDIDQQVADLGTSFEDVKTKAKDAWDATASGAKDASEKQAIYAQSVRDAKSDVVDLGKQIGLSVPDVKKMLLQIDNGNLEDVQRQLDIMARNRTMELSIIAKGGPGFGVPSPGGANPGPRAVLPPAVSTVNVTQYLPRGFRGDALSQARSAARRSGGLYQRFSR